MKYYSKKTRKIKKKMVEYKSKDDLETGQFDRVQKLKKKRDRLLNRGGKVERSHKKVVGNLANKNIDKRYDAAGKVLDRIDSKKKLKEEWADSTKIMNKTYEIFRNPSLKEIGSIDGPLRFILVQPKKNIYVFSEDLLHQRAAKMLNLNYTDVRNNYYGTGVLLSGKIKVGVGHRLIAFFKRFGKDTDWVWDYLHKNLYEKDSETLRKYSKEK
jgi:hypothetical protein